MSEHTETYVSDPAISPFRGDFRRRGSGKSQGNPDPYRVVSVRLRTAEYLGFEEQAQNIGLTKNQAMRIAARRIAGFLEIDAETRRLLTDISRRLNEISRSLVMLNKTCSANGTVDLAELAVLRKAFGEEYVRLEAKIKVLLNVSLRRQDGLALLKKMETL